MFSKRLTRTLAISLRAAWVLLSCWVLASWMHHIGRSVAISDSLSWEGDLLHMVLMAALSFPWGYLVFSALSGLAYLGLDISTGTPELTWQSRMVIWMAMAVGGYIQWFHLVPLLANRLRMLIGRGRDAA